MAGSQKRLFMPLKLGKATLEHRIAMAPLTRFRAPNHIPVERHATYYGQRATKGGLLITEATYIAPEAGGYEHVPGIHSAEQIKGWKAVTEAVHAKGGVIYVQLWALGRANRGDKDVKRVVSASNLPMPNGPTPEPLSVEEIQQYVQNYRQAALNAIEAGFDGVEIHNANGYLPHQFLEASSNDRSDDYGGSIEKRARFSREILAAITSAIGEERTGIRLAPWTTFQGMGQEPDTYATYTSFLTHIRDTYPRFSYVHIVEDSGAWMGKEILHPRTNDPFRALFRKPGQEGKLGQTFGEFGEHGSSPTVFIACGDFRTESSHLLSQEKGDIVAIGRSFISNPDIVNRIREDQEFTPYNRDTFYLPLSDIGYIDYATYGKHGHGEEAAEKRAAEQKNKANM